MGTSSSGAGAGNKNPLIPSWIAGEDSPTSPPQDASNDDGNGKSVHQPDPQLSNRYTAPRKAFNKFISSRGGDTKALRKALKNYSRNAAGGTSGMAKRMRPATARVAGFVTAINTIRQVGVTNALRQFNLSAYHNSPLLDTLSALCDEIFKDSGKPFENTQDDSITKEAYANTVMRISEIDDIALDKLTNENVEVMVAIFIEETIAQRVITDIGNKMTRLETDPVKLVEMENTVYQMVNGLVRNQIMPEIIATQLGDKQFLEKNIENVYRIAFDVMSNIKE